MSRAPTFEKIPVGVAFGGVRALKTSEWGFHLFVQTGLRGRNAGSLPKVLRRTN